MSFNVSFLAVSLLHLALLIAEDIASYVVKVMQFSRKWSSSGTNPAKSIEVNDVQYCKNPCPRLVTLRNPVQSMEINDVQHDKKPSPRLVTLHNPAKSIEVNNVQSAKK